MLTNYGWSTFVGRVSAALQLQLMDLLSCRLLMSIYVTKPLFIV